MNSNAEPDSLPIIDWEQAVKLAGSRMDLAKDFLKLFVASLPNELIAMEELKNNREDFLKRIHKVRGAAAYCGIPRFQQALLATENLYKNDNTPAEREASLNLLLAEARQLIETHSKL